ncbi:SRPBCC family protein [Robiginitalea sp. SC105]|uniref:SRPBCC family protein n=1 Tax=Robiginitalea sp. SC105 TaxID=2762332 RepID=UPI0016395B8B|nr:SRPBCC family protein [Robiginitalea sp. SC105]
MKYTCEIAIDLPRDKMVALLDNPENMKHWQQGLKSYRVLSGVPGREGAQMELEYQMGKRHLVMVETLIKHNPPHELHTTYDTRGVHNIQKNYFEEVGENSSRWISESEFQFSSLPLKLMGWFMPGAFKKQSMKYLEDFKRFAETGESVSG